MTATTISDNIITQGNEVHAYNDNNNFANWNIVDDLLKLLGLGRGREPVSSAIDVEIFNQFLRRKLPK